MDLHKKCAKRQFFCFHALKDTQKIKKVASYRKANFLTCSHAMHRIKKRYKQRLFHE